MAEAAFDVGHGDCDRDRVAYLLSLLLPSTHRVRAVGVTVAGSGVGDRYDELTLTSTVDETAILTMAQARKVGTALLDSVQRYG